MTRRLAAILAADVVGYSSLMNEDEAGTLAALNAYRAEVFDPIVAERGGRVVKLMGDGTLVEFPSVVEAVEAALAIQKRMAETGGSIQVRIGINLGDVIVDGPDIYGSGINVAARLEALAEPGGVCISSIVRESIGDRAGTEFADAGEHELKGIPRPIRVWHWPARGVGGPGIAPPALPKKPSIAVLPFTNMSGDLEQRYFSDGITDDVITDLSRYDELFVIARHSSFAYRDLGIPPAQIARELGVQYITEGSVRRAGSRIRVTAQLIDPWAGQQLWAERYDRDLMDIFELQDELAAVIVNTVAGQITRQHYKRSLAKSPDAVDAYEHVLRALELTLKLGPEENRRAREEAERALAIDPNLPRAHAIVGWSYISEAGNFWGTDPAREFDLAHQAALAAVAADEREPLGHVVLGWVYMWRDRAFERALEELKCAVSLNPGSAYCRSYHAFALCYAGQSELAVGELEAAMRLNPHFPILYHVHYARALFNLRRYAEAMPHLERVRASMPDHANALALVAACYAALDRLDEARETAEEVGKASRAYTLSNARQVVPYALAEELEHFLSMLRRAGLPE